MLQKLQAILIGSLLLFITANAQNDTINQLDAQGQKQGYWQKKYPNGKLVYEGYFQNGKPVGEMHRYYETGELKAIMSFREKSEKVYTKLYYEDGEIAGEGNYINNKKDSLWTYYSYYTGTITSTEFYVNGVKHGFERKYYANGQVSEEIEWSQNMKLGVWNQYFEDGAVKLKTTYSYNSLNGPYSFYWPNGNVYILGNFVDNKQHGTWSYFTDDGNKKSEIVYQYGKSENEEEIIAKDQEFFKMVEENMGKFEDPSIEDVMPGSTFY
jgi:antitoxin component YwqK of YwqJK toxin-antitoxin module